MLDCWCSVCDVFSFLTVGTVCAVFSILNVGTVCVLYLVYCMLVQPVCAIFSILFGGTVCMLNVSTWNAGPVPADACNELIRDTLGIQP